MFYRLVDHKGMSRWDINVTYRRKDALGIWTGSRSHVSIWLGVEVHEAGAQSTTHNFSTIFDEERNIIMPMFKEPFKM